MLWAVVAATAAGCYALKLAGLAVPARLLDRPAVRRLAELVPVALLAALVAVQAAADGRSLGVDARLAGLAAAAMAVALRAPFLVVVALAAVVAAGVRALAG